MPPPPPPLPRLHSCPPVADTGEKRSSRAVTASAAMLAKQVAARARDGRNADDKLVVVRLRSLPVAEEEQSFATVCSEFLAKAQQKHDALMERAEAARANLSALTTYLGEPPESDAAQTFGLIWNFVTCFDRAFVKVARASFCEKAAS